MTRELFPNDSIRPPTTATPPSLSPRTPPSRPCTLADKKEGVMMTSGVGCVRVALFFKNDIFLRSITTIIFGSCHKGPSPADLFTLHPSSNHAF